MANATPRQDRFDGGEIADTWYGRTNSPRYGISLRTCKNFLPIQQGALVNRPGWMYVGAPRAADPTYERFVFSDTQTFILEFTAGFVRFWTNGGLVVDGGGNPIAVATPYGANDLERLKFSQSGDVIVIDHPSYQPRELVRITNTNWVLSLQAFSPPAGFVPQTVSYRAGWYGTEVAPGYGAATPYAPGQYVFDTTAGDNRVYLCLVSCTGKTPSTNPNFWALAADATHPLKEWAYAVTALYKDQYGIGRETLPGTTLTLFPVVPGIARYTDRPSQIAWAAPANPGFSYKLTGYRIYVGRNGLWGWLADVDEAATTFKDDALSPNYGIQPPKGTNPFLIADGNNTANTSKWPGCVTHHESRRVHARTDIRPNHFLGSRQDDFSNHDVSFPVVDTDAYDFGISSQELEEIRSIVSFHRLLLFTGQGVFSAEGAPGSAITPNSIRVRKHTRAGASYLDPLLLEDSAVLFTTAKGTYVRDLIYDYQSESFRVGKIDVYARHLLKDHTIIDWCFAETPYGVLWAVRDDGVLLSCTYDRSTETVGWARHPTRGKVRRVVSVPEGDEDAVYVHVVRNGVLCFERMATRALPQVADGVDEETGLTKYRDDVRFCVFLDGSLKFDGRNTAVTTMKVTGASFDAEQIVTVEVSNASFVLTDIGDQIVIDPDGEPTHITVQARTDASHVTGRLEESLPAAFQAVPTTAWGWARDTLTGYGHLEGQTVKVLADGMVQGPFVVAGGAIPLEKPALIAVAGLSYNSDAELLDLAAASVRTNQKVIVKMTWEVVKSRSFLVGEKFTDLKPAQLRKVSDNFGVPKLVTDQVSVDVNSTWNRGARAVVRQADPLPLTIVAAIREVEVGGRGG
jgi:hypothetical protein